MTDSFPDVGRVLTTEKTDLIKNKNYDKKGIIYKKRSLTNQTSLSHIKYTTLYFSCQYKENSLCDII